MITVTRLTLLNQRFLTRSHTSRRSKSRLTNQLFFDTILNNIYKLYLCTMVSWRDICMDYRTVEITWQNLFASLGASLISLSILHIVCVWPQIIFFKFRLGISHHADFVLVDQLVNLLIWFDTELSLRQRVTVPIAQVTLSFLYILYSALILLHWLSDFHELPTCLVC